MPLYRRNPAVFGGMVAGARFGTYLEDFLGDRILRLGGEVMPGGLPLYWHASMLTGSPGLVPVSRS